MEVATLKGQLKEHYTHMKNTAHNNSATMPGTSFLQSLLEGSSIGTIRSLKKEIKSVKAKVR
jgi:hypothetical protein